MTDRELLERCGHLRHSVKKMGCIKQVFWVDKRTGEIVNQAWLVLQERNRRKYKKQMMAENVT